MVIFPWILKSWKPHLKTRKKLLWVVVSFSVVQILFKKMLRYESLWHVYYLGPLFNSWTSKFFSNLVLLIRYLHKEIVKKLKNMTHCLNLLTFRPWILKSHELVDLPHNLKSQLRHIQDHHLNQIHINSKKYRPIT